MQAWIITLLISLGYLVSAQQWDNMSKEEKDNLNSVIINMDAIGMAPDSDDQPDVFEIGTLS
jgi:hypothetical protein